MTHLFVVYETIIHLLSYKADVQGHISDERSLPIQALHIYTLHTLTKVATRTIK